MGLEYARSFLCAEPIGDLTPYYGIRAVLPAHVLTFQGDRIATFAHWNWIADRQLLYRSDLQYEEHFGDLFRQAVLRCTESRVPILAQLSGGMDSASIVCMSDHIRNRGDFASADMIDTISFFD